MLDHRTINVPGVKCCLWYRFVRKGNFRKRLFLLRLLRPAIQKRFYTKPLKKLSSTFPVTFRTNNPKGRKTIRWDKIIILLGTQEAAKLSTCTTRDSVTLVSPAVKSFAARQLVSGRREQACRDVIIIKQLGEHFFMWHYLLDHLNWTGVGFIWHGQEWDFLD